ncbi:protein FAM169B isoform X4 [Sander vitreus]
MYPVDLPDVDDAGLTSASEQYLSYLESRPWNNEWFQLSQTSKVAITADNARRVQLFEDDQPDCALLALYSPDDPTQVVALYLHEKWWCVEDVLRTSSKSRSGLITVQSMMERVIVFLLSQVVERSSQEKALFSLHPRTESCKLLWRDSQAVGFYTVKHKVCRSFLQQHEEHLEQLYEVETPGDWTQRRNIWLSIQLGRYSLDNNEENSPTSGETQRIQERDSSQKSLLCFCSMQT